MKANDFVNRVLADSAGGINVLLDLADRSEVSWLELKASFLPKDNIIDNPEKENKVDYVWHVVRAIISLANGPGGILILGIDEGSNKCIGIEHCGYNGDQDLFIRTIIYKVFFPTSGKWNCKRKQYSLDNIGLLKDLIEARVYEYNNKHVLSMIISPINNPADLLVNRIKGNERLAQMLYARARGNQGDTTKYEKHSDIERYIDQRDIAEVHFEGLHKKFERTISRGERYIQKTKNLDEDIKKYNKKFVQIHEEQNSVFTRLKGQREAPISDHIYYIQPEVDRITNTGIEKNIESSDIFEIIDSNKSVLILGEPGSGKTTVFRNYIYEKIKNEAFSNTFNIFIPIATYDGSTGLENFIINASSIVDGDFQYLAGKGRVRIFIDGINEVAERLQKSIFTFIQKLRDDYNNLKLVLSSREKFILDYSSLDFERYEIKPLSKEKQQTFLEKYLPNEKNVKQILDQIYELMGGDTIASNPWMLFMVSEIYKEQKVVPESRTDLYDKYFSAWYKREKDKAKEIKRSFIWDSEEIALERFSEIAADMRINGISKEIGLKKLRIISSINAKELETGIKELSQGGLLNIDENNKFSFRHETLQEYLIAKKIVSNYEFLIDLKKNVYADMELPIAYAIELKPKLEQRFIDIISKIDYRLTCFAIDRIEQIIDNLPIEDMSKFWKDTVSYFLDQNNSIVDNKIASPTKDDIIFLSKESFQYLIRTNRRAKNNYNTAKVLWLKKLEPYDLMVLYENGIIKNSDIRKIKNDLIKLEDSKVNHFLFKYGFIKKMNHKVQPEQEKELSFYLSGYKIIYTSNQLKILDEKNQILFDNNDFPIVEIELQDDMNVFSKDKKTISISYKSIVFDFNII